MAKWKTGITGGIGSGKTFCARIFEQLGIPVYYSDDRAKHLMTHDPEVVTALVELLGPRVYDANHQLQKDFLRKQVFENPTVREKINAIVHPAVGRDYVDWHHAQDSPYTLQEAALLVESGSYRKLDHLIMVRAPRVLRTQRIMARDGISVDAVTQRMNSQFPDSKKEKVADLFIDNSGCYAILPQILAIHHQLIQSNDRK